MQKISFACVVVLMGMLLFVSCSEEVSNSLTLQESSGSVLRVLTRSTSLDDAIAQTNVYLFDADGHCAGLLQPNENGSYTSAKLPAGTYTVCAVGGADLSCFTMPSASDATKTTLITVVEGQTMGDLLMASSTISLNDGDEQTLDLTLLRRILEVSTVTIRQVPETVTAVELTLSPLYSGVLLDGTLPTSATASCNITLTQTADGVWQSTASQLIFPTGADPLVTVKFTNAGSDTPSTYTYTLPQALVANYKFNIEGTYTEPLGVILKGSVTAQAWNETAQSITFDFDETNASTENGGSDNADNPSDPTPSADAPVVGSTYLDYYVVSVNTSAKTVVLMSTTSATEKTSYAKVEAFMQGLSKPQGAVGEWRIPTEDECRTCLSFDHVDINRRFYVCQNGETLKTILFKYENGERVYSGDGQSEPYTGIEYILPVIDVAYN